MIKTGDLVVSQEVESSDFSPEEKDRHAFRVLSIDIEEETSPLGRPVRFLRLQHSRGTADFAFNAFEGYYRLWKSHEERLAERFMETR